MQSACAASAALCNKQTANFLLSQTSVLLESICSFSFNHQISLLSLLLPPASTYRLIPKPLHTLLTSHNLLQTCPRPVKPVISPTPPLTPSRLLSQLLPRTMPLFQSKPLVSHRQPRTVRYVHTANPVLSWYTTDFTACSTLTLETADSHIDP